MQVKMISQVTEVNSEKIVNSKVEHLIWTKVVVATKGNKTS